MNMRITKGARQYGYLIWNSRMDADIETMLSGLAVVNVCFNGFNLGTKNIDRKYHRINSLVLYQKNMILFLFPMWMVYWR